MDAELRMHIATYVEDLVRSGVGQEEATRRAHIEFGSLEASKDQCRQAWGLEPLDELRANLRLAFRNIRHSPGFAAIAVLSLALGIGANTAIFGVFDAVMLRLLPVRDPSQLALSRWWVLRARWPALSVLRMDTRSRRRASKQYQRLARREWS